MNLQIFHNPRCGKSRDALSYLYQKELKPEIIFYLQHPPSFSDLKDVIRKLNIKPAELIRNKEKVFVRDFKGKNFSDDEWIKIMSENPILIERPIIITEEKAVIGRPKERIDELIMLNG